ncbi:hypothetical protein [Neorhizobium petrolearium]|uniref:hypothetical protein n=1 Tax=Neorhizobium petrolearium TaxID=515361 RepID=UPI003F14EAE9
MDPATIGTVLGLATSAVGLTGKAADTISSIKGLFDSGKAPDNAEATKLLNALAAELTAANMTNVQLSQALKALSAELSREDEFEREKARYELHQTGEGAYVLKLKEDMANGQPQHFICPTCFNKDKLVSYLAKRNSDFMACQANGEHLFRFKNTPWDPPRTNRGGVWST